MAEKADRRIALTRLRLGEWLTEVVHPSTGEIVRVEISIKDFKAHPVDDFGKDRIENLIAICDDAFALRDMYLESISDWRASHLHDSPNALDEFNQDEIECMESKGIDVSLLARKDPIEMAKWLSAFRLAGEVIGVEFGYHYKSSEFTTSKAHGVSMSACVIDPGDRRWTCKLGEDQNRHEEGEGYIEHG